MKATNLMIGDWVYCITDNTNVQIEEIFIDDIYGWCYKYEGKLNALNDIEPIPLTKEILEKNGFEKSQGEKFTWFICNVAAFDIRIVNEKNNLYDIKIAEYPRPITYVHELQHLLKLCKIEKEIVL